MTVTKCAERTEQGADNAEFDSGGVEFDSGGTAFNSGRTAFNSSGEAFKRKALSLCLQFVTSPWKDDVCRSGEG